MMFIHIIYNNILNYGAIFSRVYQEESKMHELYQEVFLGQNQTKQTDKMVVHVYPSALVFLIVPLHVLTGGGCSGLVLFYCILILMGERVKKNRWFFIRLLKFTSTIMYSVVCNQSPFLVLVTKTHSFLFSWFTVLASA